MLGHRGVRLGITHPGIYEMQVQAILEAAVDLFRRRGFDQTRVQDILAELGIQVLPEAN